MDNKRETASENFGDGPRKGQTALFAKWFDKLKPNGKPSRRISLVAAAVMGCAYLFLVVTSDLAQSLTIGIFYDRLSIHTQGAKHECGDRGKVYEINAHYSDVLFLRRSPEVTAKPAILDDGPCLSVLLKSLHDTGSGIRAVIGERNSGIKSLLVEISQP